MSTSNNYIISGGQSGKSRLSVLAGVLHDSTKALLEIQGLCNGKTFLDAGCGGGHVALMAAQAVGNGGCVTGVDFDEEIITLNQQEAETTGIKNVSFRAASVYDIEYKNEFDIAYARFLLSHLQEPAKALAKIVQAVKPGGRVVVEDVHFSGHFCYPACAAFERYVQYYIQAATNNGQNAEIAPSLLSLFRDAGLTDIGFDVIQPTFNIGQGKWMGYITLDRIKNTLVKQGIATAEAVDGMLTELEEFTKDETTIISLPRIFRVWGTRG